MWEIISFGDVITLTQVFNAISVIFRDNGYQAAAVAIILFVCIGLALHNLIGGAKELPFTQLFAGVFAFFIGFSTYTNVSIENRFDGSVTQIDNIPIAIAVPASLVSTIGLWLTEKTETAFANVGTQKVSSDGYLSPLKTIANMRRKTYDNACVAGMANSTATYNLCQSVRPYMADCAAVKANRDNFSINMQKEDFVASIRFDSYAYTTKMVRADGTEEIMACADAYQLLETNLTNTEDTRLGAIGDVIGTKTGSTGIDTVKDALAAIGADSSKATNFANTMYLLYPAEQGTIDYLQKNGARDIAENYSSSIQQRNYEWALQADMFIQILDKVLSLFEAVMYAIAPFIGLMVLTGTLGMKSLLLYIQMLLVIQFMPPMLVIVQNIILSDLAQYQKGLLAQGMSEGSVDYLIALTKKTNELMGLGGFLATTIVPALAMSLVTGSGFAMMGAIKSAATGPKDTDAVPDSAKQGGINDLSALNNGTMNRYGDLWSQDAKSAVIGIDSSSQLQSAIDNKLSQKETAESAYNASRSNVMQYVEKSSYSDEKSASYGQQLMTSTGAGRDWTTTTNDSLNKTHGISKEGASTVAGHLALGARAGFEAGMFFTAGANGEAMLKEEFKEGLSEKDQQAFAHMIQTGEAEKVMQSFTDQVTSNVQDNEKLTTGSDHLDGLMSKVDNAYSEKVTATSEYNAANSIMKQLQLGNTDLEGVYNQLGNNQGAINAANKIIDSLSPELKSRYYDFHQDYSTAGGTYLDGDTAKIAALSAALKNSGEADKMLDVISASGLYGNDVNGMKENLPKVEAVDTSNVQQGQPETTIANTNPTKDDIEATAAANNARVISTNTTNIETASNNAQAMQGKANAEIFKGQADLNSQNIFDGNKAHGMKEILSHLTSGNLSDKDFKQAYEDLKKYVGVDASNIPNPVNDWQKSYLETPMGQLHLNISGYDTSKPANIEQRFADNMEYHDRMASLYDERAQTSLSDTRRLEYQQNAITHREMKEALVEEREKFRSGAEYNTSIQDKYEKIASDRAELTSRLEAAKMAQGVINSELNNPRFNTQSKEYQGNLIKMQSESQKDVVFLFNQLEEIKKGNEYVMSRTELENKEKFKGTIPL